jgi:hypothetical protein
MAHRNPVVRFAERCQHRILAGRRYDYVLLVAMAFLPWMFAMTDGTFSKRPADAPVAASCATQVAAPRPAACQSTRVSPCPSVCLTTCPASCTNAPPKVAAVPPPKPTKFPSYTCIGSKDCGCNGVQPSGWTGYLQRKNWSWLIFELPLALLALRYSANRLFLAGLRKKRVRQIIVIPDLIQPPSQVNTREKLLAAAMDWKNFGFALLVDLVLHGIDLRDTVSIYVHAALKFWPWLGSLKLIPYHWYISRFVWMSEWDWTSYFLAAPSKRNLLRNLALVLVAYPSQFLMVLFAMTLLIILFRHNLYFLKSIYTRSRRGRNDPADFIALDFDDPERRMGMGPLGTLFNAQMIVLIVAGALTLTSRYLSARLGPVKDYIRTLDYGEFINPPKVLLGPPYSGSELFPDPGQKLFAIVWLIMFAAVMMPALAKCLPLRPWGFREPGVLAFLREFVPPNRWKKANRTDEEVTALAQSFACQSFWPVGDASAQALSVLCFFIFAIMIVPMPPATVKQDLYLLEMLVVCYTISQSLFWILRYVLAIVDKRLISKA